VTELSPEKSHRSSQNRHPYEQAIVEIVPLIDEADLA